MQFALVAAVMAQSAAPVWPRQVTAGGAQVTVYQPQAISWSDRTLLTARAALSITPPQAKAPVLGTIEVTLATKVDTAAGIVHLSDPKLIGSHFPTLSTDQASAVEAKVRAGLAHMEITEVPLNNVLLSLKQQPSASVAVDNTPPVIFHSTGPASLVVFDGQPVTAPAGTGGVFYAVNTNWDVFTVQGSWYLLNNGVWFKAADALGPYSVTPSLPPAFSTIPNNANFAGVHAHIPAHAPPASAPVPTIFVSSSPAEIIVTNGPPKLETVAGTPLQRVTNTVSTVFFDPNDKHFYYLTSGRWFSAPSLDGPWQYATPTLPPEFALLPESSSNDAVLSAVPGTAEAQRAVLLAQLPHTATLKRDQAKPEISYSGAPMFKAIPGTQILYAVNTADEVLKIGARYYACYQGAWFVADSPSGPWGLADSVPPEVKSIPPSSPLYNVTYVQVYGATPQAVTYGYTAGYMMGFVSAGVLVYGTGYYYPPVVIHGPVPVFYPYPYTYAGSVWYNPSSGAWARGGTIYGPYGAASGGRYYNPSTGGWAQAGAIYGPYGGAGAWSYYNPRTGTYSRGSAVWGGGSGTAHASFYNPRYGVSGSTTQNASPYARWGSSTFTGPSNTVNTASGRNANGAAGGFNSSSGAAGAGYHNRATGNSGGAVRTQSGDVYAGRDGNVYKHTDSGWSKYDNGGWNPVTPPQRSSGSQPGSTNRQYQGQYQGQRSNLDRSNYQQLEQDRFGRQYGAGRQMGGFEGGGGRFRR